MKRSFGERDLDEFRARLADLRAELVVPTVAGAYVAHTDGACLGNPEGPGGWAAVVDEGSGSGQNPLRWLLYGHLSSTSNNRAEALGVLGALEWVPAGSQLELHSDSELTVRILQGRYKAKANPDVWEVIRQTIADKKIALKPEWLRGHAGDPLNELADRLSKLGALNRPLDDLADIAVAVSVPPDRDRGVPPELAGLEPRTDWEREFLKSVGDQLRRRRPITPKQQAILDRIRAYGSQS